MAITVPVTKTKIATAAWGIPITNEVNRLTTQSNTNTTDITNLKTATAVTAWTAPSFTNGWGHHNVNAHPVKYRKVGDVVEVRGVATGGALGSQMFVLPAGFRPPFDIGFVVYAGATNPGYITVDGAGSLVLQLTGTLGAFVYLDPVRYSITP